MIDYFINLSKDEIEDIIESRLMSNNYGDEYHYDSVDIETETIFLIHELCGKKIQTTLQDIEEGTLSKLCKYCVDKKMSKQQDFAQIVAKNNLELVRLDDDNFYFKCKLCGRKYYLNKDFYSDSEPYGMCCKNWDCMMSLLKKEKHWFALGLESGEIRLSPPQYAYTQGALITDYDEWFDDLEEFALVYQRKCKKCGCESTGIVGKNNECEACYYIDNESIHIIKWDHINDIVSVHCLKCGNEFQLTSDQMENEIFDCFECYLLYCSFIVW